MAENNLLFVFFFIFIFVIFKFLFVCLLVCFDSAGELGVVLLLVSPRLFQWEQVGWGLGSDGMTEMAGFLSPYGLLSQAFSSSSSTRMAFLEENRSYKTSWGRDFRTFICGFHHMLSKSQDLFQGRKWIPSLDGRSCKRF